MGMQEGRRAQRIHRHSSAARSSLQGSAWRGEESDCGCHSHQQRHLVSIPPGVAVQAVTEPSDLVRVEAQTCAFQTEKQSHEAWLLSLNFPEFPPLTFCVGLHSTLPANPRSGTTEALG